MAPVHNRTITINSRGKCFHYMSAAGIRHIYQYVVGYSLYIKELLNQ